MNFKSLTLFPDFTDSFFSDRFNRIDKLFSQLTGDSALENISPNYNVKKIDIDNYELIISLPGWREEELEIKLHRNQLNVVGKKKYEISSNKPNDMWIHQGIRKLNFNISYSLPNNVKVKEAKLQDGCLYINLYQEIPEKDKPEIINISN